MKNNRLIKIIISLLCCIVVITIAIIIAIHLNNKNDSNNFSDDNYISLDYGFTEVKVTDEKSALKAISSVADVIGISNVDDELKINDVNTIGNDTYYRFQQYYNDIPVYGKSVCLVCDKDGQAATMTANYIKPKFKKTIVDAISDNEIQKSVKNYFDMDNISVDKISDDNLVYYIDLKNEMQLAYKIISYSTDNIYEIIINAKNAEIISSVSLLDDESANIYSKKSRDLSAIGWKNDDNSYHLYNEKYNISIFDFKKAHTNLKEDNGENKILLDFTEYGMDTIYSNTDEFEEDAVLLLKNLINVNDYYNKLGFDGFYRTHACLNDKRFYKNAAGGSARDENNQDCAIIYIGEKSDSSSLDLIGHEYTHAITRSKVSWNGEQPGINEGFSDVFGEFFEYYINGETDWIHGPRIIRNPSENNYPQSINDENNSGEDDSHGYSTVISHTAYLMWNGIDGDEYMKIDCNKLAQLWYRTLSIMHSDCTFNQFANAITLTATHMVRYGELTPMQLQCVLKALDKTGIQNYNDLSAIQSCADLCIKDMNLKSYDNYHLTVTEILTIDLQLGKTVIDTDVSSPEKYKLNLEAGKYILSVKDNSQQGSDNTFSRIITVVEPTYRNRYHLLNTSVTIYTDFGTYTMMDYLGLEFEELTDLHGDNYDICDSAGWIPSSPSRERMIGYKNIPFSFLVWTGRDTPLAPYENDEITDVMYTKSSSNDVYSIDGNIQTNITWSELQKNTVGIKWIDNQYYAYSYKIEDPLGDISVIFQYENIPNENSTADYIILTEYFDVAEEDWSTNIFYQPIIEKYRAECEQLHNHDDYTFCCTWFLFDVDNNGVDELIIQEQEGGAEQAKYHHYFTISNNKVIELGGYSAWHMGLYEENGMLFGKVVSPNSPTEFYQISISNNKVENKLIKTIDKSSDDGDYPPYSNAIMPMDISYDINEY